MRKSKVFWASVLIFVINMLTALGCISCRSGSLVAGQYDQIPVNGAESQNEKETVTQMLEIAPEQDCSPASSAKEQNNKPLQQQEEAPLMNGSVMK